MDAKICSLKISVFDPLKIWGVSTDKGSITIWKRKNVLKNVLEKEILKFGRIDYISIDVYDVTEEIKKNRIIDVKTPNQALNHKNES